MKQYNLNNQLAKLYFSSGMTQKGFAKLIGVDKYLLHDWIKSRSQIRFSRFEEIVKKLNKEIEIVIK